jgi:hypothetical protein
MSTLRVDSLRGQTADGVNKYVVQVLQGEILTQVSNSSSSYSDLVSQAITPKLSNLMSKVGLFSFLIHQIQRVQ